MIEKDAVISPCGTYRYKLTRKWDKSKHNMIFIMLNPSTADTNIDDPTIRKCIGFAERLGYGGITVVNLFAYRATKPSDMKAAGWLAGEYNATHINVQFNNARIGNIPIYCAWGANARGTVAVESFLQWAKASWPTVELMALRLLADGTPQHPLMLP